MLCLSGILLMSAGCESEECDVTMLLGGALEQQWEWTEATTDCRVFSDPAIGTHVTYEHGGQMLEFIIPSAIFQPGAYPLTILNYESGGQAWQLQDSSNNCIVDVEAYELVDWVRDDHHRFNGTIMCSGPLVEAIDDSELTLSNVTFSIYAGNEY